MTAYLKLFRSPLVFTAIADSAAGYLMGSPRGIGGLVPIAISSAGLYCFGMAMNDVADRARDKELYPNRVLPSGRLSLRQAFGASIAVLLVSGAAIALATKGSPARLGVWGLMVLFILAYDFWIKIPLVMGLIRALNFILGLVSSVVGEDLFLLLKTPAWLVYPGALFVYVAALTFVSTLEEGRLRRGRLLAGVLFMIAAAAGVATVGMIAGSALGWVASGPLIAWLLVRAYGAVDRKGVMLLVRDGVGGIILFDAAMLLGAKATWEGLAVAALLVPAALGVALFKRLP